MLNRTHSLLIHHIQAATHSLNSLCRKPLATMMTVVVIAIALALPALCWVFTDNLSQLTLKWQKGGRISLYLDANVSTEEQTVLLQKIRSTQGVGQVSLKSADDGLAELTQQEGMQDIMRYLPENPLPAVIEVVPALAVDSPAKLDLLSRQLETLPKVGLVKMDKSWINRLHIISGFAANVSKGLMSLLALAVMLIIGNTLRLAIHNRHEEIQVLKLIGATDPFIMRPFLYSGVWYGLVGAVLAVFLVNIIVFSLQTAVHKVTFVYQMHYPLSGMSMRQILMLLFFAIILGWLGARLSVKRQLSFIEPYI